MTAYVYEFLYRGRDPQFEDGQKSDYHVVLAEFQTTAFGPKASTMGPLTPAQAEAQGFTLDKILNAVTAGALANADAADAAATAAANDRDEAVKQAKAMELQRNDAVKAQNDAVALVLQHQQLLQDANAKGMALAAAANKLVADLKAAHADELDAVKADLAETQAQLDEATAPSDEPSNPLLNALTFGLAGK